MNGIDRLFIVRWIDGQGWRSSLPMPERDARQALRDLPGIGYVQKYGLSLIAPPRPHVPWETVDLSEVINRA